MALTVSYPGVYVQDIGGPAPPDAGVTTSLAAFIGRAPMGPVEAPVLLNSWGDYQCFFGGLDADSSMSYQVSAFFENGGGQALCVRLFEPPAGGDMDGCRASISLGSGAEPLVLGAASPGSWGDGLTATVDTMGITADTARGLGVSDPAILFNLTVVWAAPNGVLRSERFTNVTLDPGHPALLLGHVLEAHSQFVTYRSGGAAAAGASGQGEGGRDSAPLSLTTYLGEQNQKTGLYALEKVAAFNILCIPPDDMDGDTAPVVYQLAAEYCAHRNAMLIIDPPVRWQADHARGDLQSISLHDMGAFDVEAGRSAAVYFPRVRMADPLRGGEVRTVPNSGYVAGQWAQTDVQYGVWKAPAGLNAAINGIIGLSVTLTDDENGVLNPLGVNCLRTFLRGGTVIWGARTLRGADELADPYTYIPVRRLMLYLTGWIQQNTKWAAFEANDPALWEALRRQVSTLMDEVWKQGALFGSSSAEAWFVKCDASVTTPDDIDAGRVNIQIGFAPVKPAEFIIITLQVTAGQG